MPRRPLPKTPPPIVPISKDQLDSFQANHDPQTACRLFQNIFPEIRNIIFLYALLSYKDLAVVYPNDALYSRPGFRDPSYIDACLLHSYKLIYLETRFLPVMVNEHIFCCCCRAPPRCYRVQPKLRHASELLSLQ